MKNQLRLRDGRYEGTITFTDMDPRIWRAIEKQLKRHSDDKRARKLLSRVRDTE